MTKMLQWKSVGDFTEYRVFKTRRILRSLRIFTAYSNSVIWGRLDGGGEGKHMAHPIPSGCWCYMVPIACCHSRTVHGSPPTSSPPPTLPSSQGPFPSGGGRRGEATWQRQRCIGPVKSENLNNNTEHRVLFITFASAFRRRFS